MHEFLHPSPFTYGLFMVSFPSKKLKQEDISRIPSRLSDIHELNGHSKLSDTFRYIHARKNHKAWMNFKILS
jgi:hypothetical protein